jgi:hypothetical protein
MGHWSVLAIAGGLAAMWLPLVMASATETDPSLVTVDKPMTITATAAPPDEKAAVAPNRPARLIVSISGFQPAADGSPVEVIVKTLNERTGAEQEVGRFGVMPHGAVGGAPPSIQRFGLALPKGLTTDHPVKLNVYLRPSIGEGKGARLKVEGAEIR